MSKWQPPLSTADKARMEKLYREQKELSKAEIARLVRVDASTAYRVLKNVKRDGEPDAST